MRLAAETGAALIVTLMMMLLLSGLALSLTLTCLVEWNITRAYGDGSEALYAADAALECAIGELMAMPDWSRALDGTAASITTDGPAGTRVLPDGSRVDLRAPAWQLFASGRLPSMLAGGIANPDVYVAVWVADDESETDGNPLVDENGTIVVLAHAYGRGRVRRAIETTIGRTPAGIRVLSWREVS